MKKQEKNLDKKRGRPAIGRGIQVNAMLRPEAVMAIDQWIQRHGESQPTRPEAVRQLVDIGLAAEKQARARAKSDAKGERDADAAKATADYAALRRAEDAKTQRLREQRLAKEDGERSAAQTLLASKQDAAAMTEKTRKKLAAEKGAASEQRTANAARAKELASKARRRSHQG